MVDYRGPEVLRDLVAAMKIPIFHRIHRIHYRSDDLSDAPLDRRVVDRMNELEQISFERQGGERVQESDVKLAREMIPSCRLDSIDAIDFQLRVNVNPAPTFGCPSR